MRTTITIAANMNCNPFVVFEQDTDEVIMLINFYVEIGDREENKHENKSVTMPTQKEKRIRVNDKTATGGWF